MMTDNVYTRLDGKQIPMAALAALRRVAADDAIPMEDEQLAAHVLVVDCAPRPLLWGSAEFLNMMARREERGDHYTAPTEAQIDSHDQAALDLWRGQQERQCHNCRGLQGSGRLYTRTGNPRRSSLGNRQEGYFQRTLEEWDCPVCAGGRQTAYLLEACGLPRHKIDRDDTFYLFGHSDMAARHGMEQAVKFFASRMVARDISGWLSLVSGHDAGKTTLLEWLTVALCRESIQARYVTAMEFESGVYGWRFEDDSIPPLVRAWAAVPVLLFDQVDWIQDTTAKGGEAFVGRWLRYLMEARYTNRNYLATVMTWNLPKWQSPGDVIMPIYRRAKEGDVVEITEDVPLREGIGKEITERRKQYETD
jgi:hypothetical protein